MDEGDMRELVDSLLDGDQGRSVVEARRLRNAGLGIERIVTHGIGTAMARLEGKCTIDEFNLLEIMLVGRAVMGVIKDMFPVGLSDEPARGTVVLASLEGDVHDLGKNMVKMVFTAMGYQVIDCGRSCPLAKLIDTAERRQADAIAISGLITTVLPQVKRVRDLLERRGLGHIRILAGGAALKQATAESLKVDFVAETAFDGARYLEKELK
jgi:dimethylamine corrinoid protein